ncbi:MAG: hypothetical protein IJP61_11950 [Treponema sp.]|nr:hypothetical protein [Treponema sp.]
MLYKKTKSTTKKIQLELLKDSWLKNVCSMARGLGIDKVTKLIQDYPFDDNSLSAPNDWAKLKAKAELFSRTEQKTYLAEIHFYARKRHGQRGYDLFELKITKTLYEI